ncbi:hypothetical protein ACLOJK_022564 [Asimina triloba]
MIAHWSWSYRFVVDRRTPDFTIGTGHDALLPGYCQIFKLMLDRQTLLKLSLRWIARFLDQKPIAHGGHLFACRSPATAAREKEEDTACCQLDLLLEDLGKGEDDEAAMVSFRTPCLPLI